MSKYSSNENKIRSAAGNAPWNVLFCPSCIPALLPNFNDIMHHRRYEWAVTILCWQCKREWNVCSQCSNARKHLNNNKQLSIPGYNKHRKLVDEKPAKKQCSTHYEEEEHLSVIHSISTESVCPSELQFKVIPGPPSFENLAQPHNKSYFQMQHNGSLGAPCLVSLTHFHTESAANSINKEEVAIHLNISSLLCSLTQGQREQFATILDQVSATAVHQNLVSTTWDTRVPRSIKDVQNLYVRGKHAIIPSLPWPPVTNVGDHGYVSLKDCVADLLGHGFVVDSIDDALVPPVVTKSSETKVAKRIQDNVVNTHIDSHNVLCLHITEWSDAFEPSSGTKNNCGSCWIKTVRNKQVCQ
jgi:hypothetical protein